MSLSHHRAAAAAEIPSREELLRRAEALVPVLRARSEDCEKQRCCPPETIADFLANGLFRVCQPARYGGYELGWDIRCEVAQVLARGCASQAWAMNILTDHTQFLGMFDPKAQHDVWGADFDTRIAASIDPAGKARRVAGGVLFSGRHGFASGIDYAQWVIAGGHIAEDGVPPRRAYFLIPKSDVTVIDDWYIIGLAGTGSKSFEVKDAFVPDYRILDGEDADNGTGPGSTLDRAPVYRMPRHFIAASGFSAVAVGIAQAFIAEWVAFTAKRRSRGNVVADLMGTQMTAGIATVQIDTAARIYLEAAREVMRVLGRGERLTRQQQLHVKLDSAYACQLVHDAAQRLLMAAGSRILFTGNVMQRQFRDLVTTVSHTSINWDNATAGYGAHLLGRDPG